MAPPLALTTPTVTVKVAGCSGNNPKIDLTLSAQPIGTGQVEIVRSLTTGGGSFASPYATATFSSNPPTWEDPSVGKNTKYYYRVRVRTPLGTSWVGPESAEVTGC